jgi:hypothetical protein
VLTFVSVPSSAIQSTPYTSDVELNVSITVLRLMFCGGLFVQAIRVGSNHVVREALVTLAKAKSRRHTIFIMLLAGPAMVRT